MGTKRSVLTDEKGLPLSIVLSGANTHDIKLLEATLDQIVLQRPGPSVESIQNLCLDAGYTGSKDKVEKRGYIAHIRPRFEEKQELLRTCTQEKLNTADISNKNISEVRDGVSK